MRLTYKSFDVAKANLNSGEDFMHGWVVSDVNDRGNVANNVRIDVKVTPGGDNFQGSFVEVMRPSTLDWTLDYGQLRDCTEQYVRTVLSEQGQMFVIDPSVRNIGLEGIGLEMTWTCESPPSTKGPGEPR